MKERLKQLIEADIPFFAEGESGWGKSEMIKQVVEELKLPLVDVRMAGIPPEDIAGIPVRGKTSYSYLPPKWVLELKDKEFVLFLDELNQASPQTLHALYGVVLDRVYAGIHMPRMHVVAAGNLLEENAMLTEIPSPLMKRFVKIEWTKNITAAVTYLNAKYGAKVTIDTIATNPRQTELGIRAFLAGCDREDVAFLMGQTVASSLYKNTQSEGTKLLKNIALIKGQLRNGVLTKKDVLSKYGAEVLSCCEEAKCD